MEAERTRGFARAPVALASGPVKGCRRTGWGAIVGRDVDEMDGGEAGFGAIGDRRADAETNAAAGDARTGTGGRALAAREHLRLSLSERYAMRPIVAVRRHP